MRVDITKTAKGQIQLKRGTVTSYCPSGKVIIKTDYTKPGNERCSISINDDNAHNYNELVSDIYIGGVQLTQANEGTLLDDINPGGAGGGGNVTAGDIMNNTESSATVARSLNPVTGKVTFNTTGSSVTGDVIRLTTSNFPNGIFPNVVAPMLQTIKAAVVSINANVSGNPVNAVCTGTIMLNDAGEVCYNLLNIETSRTWTAKQAPTDSVIDWVHINQGYIDQSRFLIDTPTPVNTIFGDIDYFYIHDAQGAVNRVKLPAAMQDESIFVIDCFDAEDWEGVRTLIVDGRDLQPGVEASFLFAGEWFGGDNILDLSDPSNPIVGEPVTIKAGMQILFTLTTGIGDKIYVYNMTQDIIQDTSDFYYNDQSELQSRVLSAAGSQQIWEKAVHKLDGHAFYKVGDSPKGYYLDISLDNPMSDIWTLNTPWGQQSNRLVLEYDGQPADVDGVYQGWNVYWEQWNPAMGGWEKDTNMNDVDGAVQGDIIIAGKWADPYWTDYFRHVRFLNEYMNGIIVFADAQQVNATQVKREVTVETIVDAGCLDMPKKANKVVELAGTTINGNEIDRPGRFATLEINTNAFLSGENDKEYLFGYSKDPSFGQGSHCRLKAYLNKWETTFSQIKFINTDDTESVIWENGQWLGAGSFMDSEATIWSLAYNPPMIIMNTDNPVYMSGKQSNISDAGSSILFVDPSEQVFDLIDVYSQLRGSVLPRLGALETNKANIVVTPAGDNYDGNIADRPDAFNKVTFKYRDAGTTIDDLDSVFMINKVGDANSGIMMSIDTWEGGISVKIDGHAIVSPGDVVDTSPFTDANGTNWHFDDDGNQVACTADVQQYITSKLSNINATGQYVEFYDEVIQKFDLADAIYEIRNSVLPRIAALETLTAYSTEEIDINGILFKFTKAGRFVSLTIDGIPNNDIYSDVEVTVIPEKYFPSFASYLLIGINGEFVKGSFMIQDNGSVYYHENGGGTIYSGNDVVEGSCTWICKQ